jgi:hypothetical protein
MHSVEDWLIKRDLRLGQWAFDIQYCVFHVGAGGCQCYDMPMDGLV